MFSHKVSRRYIPRTPKFILEKLKAAAKEQKYAVFITSTEWIWIETTSEHDEKEREKFSDELRVFELGRHTATCSTFDARRCVCVFFALLFIWMSNSQWNFAQNPLEGRIKYNMMMDACGRTNSKPTHLEYGDEKDEKKETLSVQKLLNIQRWLGYYTIPEHTRFLFVCVVRLLQSLLLIAITIFINMLFFLFAQNWKRDSNENIYSRKREKFKHVQWKNNL